MKKTPVRSNVVGKKGKSEKKGFVIFDFVGDRYFPRHHVPFRLDGEAFSQKPLPNLPSAKDKIETLQWAENTSEGIAEYEKLKHEAEKAERLEKKDGQTKEEREDAIGKIRFGIDEFLLCRKKNPRAVTDLAEMLDYGVTQLYLAARKEKNKTAATLLTTLLAKHVEMLRDLATQQPEMVRELAHQLPAFPVPGSIFRDEQIKNERLLKKVLEVGRDYWDQQRRKQGHSNKAGSAKEIARKLIAYLHQYRMGYNPNAEDLPEWTKKLPSLPKLSSNHGKDWFELAWQVVLETTNGQPRRVPAYAAIAKRSERKSYRRDGLVIPV